MCPYLFRKYNKKILVAFNIVNVVKLYMWYIK